VTILVNNRKSLK